jgi:serine/threonine-protein kinase
MNLEDFKRDVADRKLVRWSLGYLAGAWILYEGLSLVSQNFGLSPAFIRAMTIVFITGLPVAMVLAWYHGEQGRQRVSGLEAFMLSALVIMGLGGAGVVAKRSPARPGASIAAPSRLDPQSVAVLPFSTLSPNPNDAYFTEGVHEEIRDQLSAVAGLKVTSRTSVMQYREGTRNMREIGQQLGVATVLEGSVRRDHDRVRITATLINATTDDHMWTGAYDGTVNDVFAIQDSVARAISFVLRGKLLGDDAETLRAPPTKNSEAYDLYLRGRSFQLGAFDGPSFFTAEKFYENAIALDPDFALPYARLSQVNARVYWMAFDRNERRMEKSKMYMEKALELQPDLPEAHAAAGYYFYYGKRDYARAKQEFNTVLTSVPGSAEAHMMLAYISRRMGEWQSAIDEMLVVSRLDPRAAENLRNLGETYEALRRYEDAERTYLQGLGIEPDSHLMALERAYMHVRWHGVTDTMRSTLQRIPPGFQPTASHLGAPRAWLAILERRYDDALNAVAVYPTPIVDMQRLYTPRSAYAGLIYELKGDPARAHAAYDSARILLEDALVKKPGDVRIPRSLAPVYAGLGRRDDAVRMARMAVDMMPVTRDAFDGPDYRTVLAAVYARNHQVDEAIAEIKALLAMPAGLHVYELRVDPRWDPIRNEPAFKSLLKGN